MIDKDRFRAELTRANLSQRELAKYLKLDEKTLSKYVNGKIEPRSGTLLKIANALDTSPEYISKREPRSGTLSDPKIAYGTVCNKINEYGRSWNWPMKRSIIDMILDCEDED